MRCRVKRCSARFRTAIADRCEHGVSGPTCGIARRARHSPPQFPPAAGTCRPWSRFSRRPARPRCCPAWPEAPATRPASGGGTGAGVTGTGATGAAGGNGIGVTAVGTVSKFGGAALLSKAAVGAAVLVSAAGVGVGTKALLQHADVPARIQGSPATDPAAGSSSRSGANAVHGGTSGQGTTSPLLLTLRLPQLAIFGKSAVPLPTHGRGLSATTAGTGTKAGATSAGGKTSVTGSAPGHGATTGHGPPAWSNGNGPPASPGPGNARGHAKSPPSTGAQGNGNAGSHRSSGSHGNSGSHATAGSHGNAGSQGSAGTPGGSGTASHGDGNGGVQGNGNGGVHGNGNGRANGNGNSGGPPAHANGNRPTAPTTRPPAVTMNGHRQSSAASSS